MLAYSDGHVESSAFSNDIVIRGDELQTAMAQGPGLAARPEAHVDLIAATADESRRPVWGIALHRIGIRSVISIQLPHAEGEPIGSLNIYNHRTDGFDCTDLETAHILARHASVALTTAAAAASLVRALKSRSSSGRAQGILMERYGIDADQASTVLQQLPPRQRAASRRQPGRPEDQPTAQLDKHSDSESPAVDDRHAASEDCPTLEDPDSADKRDGAGAARDAAARDRDRSGTVRDSAGCERDRAADAGDRAADQRDQAAEVRDQAEETSDARTSPTGSAAEHSGLARRQAAADRREAARDRLSAASERRAAGQDRDNAKTDRGAGATQRRLAADDRAAAATDRQHAAVDDLTGAYTRRAGTRELDREIARAARSKQPLIVVFLDVDGLKATNDSRGHAAGDQLLRQVVQTLRANLRPSDLVIRYGGDEFVCVLPGMDMTTATKRLANINPTMPEAQAAATITMGLAELHEGETCEAVVSRADAAFYQQRRSQRSRDRLR